MKLPIKTKRDWVIVFIIAFIALYYFSMYYNFNIECLMMRFTPDKLNAMNYPSGWGNMFFVGLIMTFLIVLTMVIQKVKGIRILITSIIGITFSICMFVGFLIHTNLIVGTSRNMDVNSLHIGSFENDANIQLTKLSPVDEDFVDAAVSLKAEPVTVQKELKAQKEDSKINTYTIWLSYPEKYGQSYDMILYVQEDRIYSYHGIGTPENRVFYKDNGFLELLQQVIRENQS